MSEATNATATATPAIITPTAEFRTAAAALVPWAAAAGEVAMYALMADWTASGVDRDEYLGMVAEYPTWDAMVADQGWTFPAPEPTPAPLPTHDVSDPQAGKPAPAPQDNPKQPRRKCKGQCKRRVPADTLTDGLCPACLEAATAPQAPAAPAAAVEVVAQPAAGSQPSGANAASPNALPGGAVPVLPAAPQTQAAPTAPAASVVADAGGAVKAPETPAAQAAASAAVVGWASDKLNAEAVSIAKAFAKRDAADRAWNAQMGARGLDYLENARGTYKPWEAMTRIREAMLLYASAQFLDELRRFMGAVWVTRQLPEAFQPHAAKLPTTAVKALSAFCTRKEDRKAGTETYSLVVTADEVCHWLAVAVGDEEASPAELRLACGVADAEPADKVPTDSDVRGKSGVMHGDVLYRWAAAMVKGLKPARKSDTPATTTPAVTAPAAPTTPAAPATPAASATPAAPAGGPVIRPDMPAAEAGMELYRAVVQHSHPEGVLAAFARHSETKPQTLATMVTSALVAWEEAGRFEDVEVFCRIITREARVCATMRLLGCDRSKAVAHVEKSDAMQAKLAEAKAGAA